jgi:hypothetical protein
MTMKYTRDDDTLLGPALLLPIYQKKSLSSTLTHHILPAILYPPF